MKKINKKLIALIGTVSFLLGFTISIPIFAAGPATIDLGTSANYAILAKTSITTTGSTVITGDIGISPSAASSLAGFSQILDASGKYSTSIYLTGKIYASDYTSPTPSYVGTSVSDMEAAYVDGAGRTPGVGATNLNVGGGTLIGNNFVPGTYTWNGSTSDVTITGDITLTGTASDIWIFQVAGTLSIEDNQNIILAGGAVPENIFWVVAGTTTLKPGSTFEGNILGGPGASTIALQNGSTLNGRALGQTDVTLIASTIGGGITTVNPQLTVIKVVVNDNDGISMITDFPLFIDGGSTVSGNTNTVSVGLHIISETYDSALYTQSFSSNCPEGDIFLNSGDDEICTITNNDVVPTVIVIPPSRSSGGTHYGCKDLNALNYEYFAASKPELCLYSDPITTLSTFSSITPIPMLNTFFIPNFPNTGFAPKSNNINWNKINNWLQNLCQTKTFLN